MRLSSSSRQWAAPTTSSRISDRANSIYIEGYAAGSAGALQSAASVGSGGLSLTLSDSTTITFSNLTDRTVLNGRIQYG